VAAVLCVTQTREASLLNAAVCYWLSEKVFIDLIIKDIM
jgi:hypothetical protein